MSKLTLDDLRKLRETKKREMSQRDMETKDTQVIVGMGTCGIAAGAKETFNAILDELDQRGIHNVALKQTGCMGLCYSEPTVEVILDGMPPVIYGKVDASVGRMIVEQHIVGHRLLNDHIFDKPAADILK
ncbi:MAG: (2Fe-2S) ferredoxin domain-containing protein [Kiritimatiellae bacterium]|nr:(2Fe-2S) ferredoxin domain-containing protein [Kiritimatiellia bacterium]MDD4735920.1 (2Fe-2S) ferredoxin domain-containing protein [Kiritimatiellia bacterium]